MIDDEVSLVKWGSPPKHYYILMLNSQIQDGGWIAYSNADGLPVIFEYYEDAFKEGKRQESDDHIFSFEVFKSLNVNTNSSFWLNKSEQII